MTDGVKESTRLIYLFDQSSHGDLKGRVATPSRRVWVGTHPSVTLSVISVGRTPHLHRIRLLLAEPHFTMWYSNLCIRGTGLPI